MCGISVASGIPTRSAANVGARVRMSLTTTWGRKSSSSGSSALAASAACWPASESGSGGGNIRYSSAAAKVSPSPSTAWRRSSQVSITTSWPRTASALPSAIAGKTCPASPKAATSTRRRSVTPDPALGGIESLAWPRKYDLRPVAVARGPQQEAHRLAEILGADHLLRRELALGELGHRRLDEARCQRRALDPRGPRRAMGRLGEVDHRGLGRGVDREPGLPALAGDRGGVDDQRLAVLSAGLAQHRQPLAGAEDQRPQVDRELHVEVLGLDLLHRRPDPDAGVVDEDVEAAVLLPVGGEDGDDVVLLGHVGGDRLDLEAFAAQSFGRFLELLRAPGRDRQGVALFAERLRDREPDPARCPGNQCRSISHPISSSSRTRWTLSVHNMAPMRAPRLAPGLLCLLATGGLIGGCGSDSGSGESNSGSREAARGRPAPPKAEFPSPEGRSLREVVKAADGPAELIVEPAAVVFYPGEN